jgi:hypothetical protein
MASIAKLVRRKLGEILLDEGLVAKEQIEEALREQSKTGELLGETMVRLGYVREEDIARAICTQFGLPYLDATRYRVAPEVAGLFPPATLYRNRCVVLDKLGRSLVVATAGVVDAQILEEFERATGSPPILYVSTNSQVIAALKRLYPKETFGNGAAS